MQRTQPGSGPQTLALEAGASKRLWTRCPERYWEGNLEIPGLSAL